MKKILLGAGLLSAAGLSAQAAVPTEVTEIITDVTSIVSSAQGLAVTVLVFGLAIGVVAKFRRGGK